MRRELCICNDVTRHVLSVIVWDLFIWIHNRLENDKAQVLLCSKSCSEGLLCFYGLCIDSFSSLRSLNRRPRQFIPLNAITKYNIIFSVASCDSLLNLETVK